MCSISLAEITRGAARSTTLSKRKRVSAGQIISDVLASNLFSPYSQRRFKNSQCYKIHDYAISAPSFVDWKPKVAETVCRNSALYQYTRRTNDSKMATGPKIVHKQFNSPIGLYSQQNIQETLNKHLQNLDNGTVGIDFNNPGANKPANLANSAVLRMLEEEERNRKGLPSQKKVVWPPVPETNGYHQTQQQSPAFYNNAQHSPSQQAQYSPSAQPQAQPQPQSPYLSPQPQYQLQPQYQPEPQYQSQPQYQPQPQYQTQSPAYCEGKRQQSTGLSKLIPVGPGASPVAPYRQGPPSPKPYSQQNSRWAPVPAPTSPQPQYTGQPQYSPQSQYSEPQYQPPQYQPPQKQFEPPPSTITLRQQQPVHQKPPPVFPSQPATASFKGGVNMRGDQKWPPQSVKEAVAAENEARMMLAKGPACRPRKVNRDYSGFFAKHALNNNYPGYRAPPGTQHFEDHSGRSSY
ncbi:DNA-directed RNA polymerase II subunit RPB1 [Papilio xuthus]|uniref:DNA-directed RNA polymerase II subunit RPB1 n=1 Tax=Papilio xuthus TaxID=66420 RepID=A0A0N1I499_PAPXU|nr:DNA-directed RNA polymerase II subunit RPB1 [Papilio xuthus]